METIGGLREMELINKTLRERGVRQRMTDKEKWESEYKRMP
jgi:hypothetical protein